MLTDKEYNKPKLTIRVPEWLWSKFKARCALLRKGLMERIQELILQDVEEGERKEDGKWKI